MECSICTIQRATTIISVIIAHGICLKRIFSFFKIYIRNHPAFVLVIFTYAQFHNNCYFIFIFAILSFVLHVVINVNLFSCMYKYVQFAFIEFVAWFSCDCFLSSTLVVVRLGGMRLTKGRRGSSFHFFFYNIYAHVQSHRSSILRTRSFHKSFVNLVFCE